MKLSSCPVAILPLRGGSKGIPRKNIRDFYGKPLFYWSAAAVLSAGFRLVISTDDKEIEKSVNQYFPEVQVLARPEYLATDTASTEDVVSHFLEHSNEEHIVLIQATSPLLRDIHILEAYDQFLANNASSLVSVTRQHKFIWSEDGNPLNYDPCRRPRRQDWNGLLVENGAIYIFTRSLFEQTGSRCGPGSELYIMPDFTSVEIDTPLDWSLVETIMSYEQMQRYT